MQKELISFTPDKEQFEILFQGFILAGHLIKEKGLSVLKREIEILDQLEAISKPCDCGKLVGGTKEPDRELVMGAIHLNDAQIAMLHGYVALIPWSTGAASRLALKTLEALENASKVSKQ